MGRNETRFAAKRQTILEAALRLLRTNGVATLRVVDVADLAGVSKPAVYYYFDDDDALLLAAYRAIVDEETTLLRGLAPSSATPATLLPLLRDIETRVGRTAVAKQCGDEMVAYWKAFDEAHGREVLRGYAEQLLPPNQGVSIGAQP